MRRPGTTLHAGRLLTGVHGLLFMIRPSARLDWCTWPACCHKAIRATIPYIRTDLPILVIFRALGLTADRDILQHVVYDFGDTEMMEALRPSIEEAFPIQSQEVRGGSALPRLAVKQGSRRASACLCSLPRDWLPPCQIWEGGALHLCFLVQIPYLFGFL